MNITPIEIRQKEFERHFRGYDKDEVNAFLHTLSQAWERMLQENRDKTARLEKAEKDIDKVREVEGTLFRTLRTAEDTSAGIVSKAQREAEEIGQQAEQQRQDIIEDARQQAAAIVEKAHQQVAQLRQDVTTAESHRQQALAQLRTLAQGILQQIEDDDEVATSVEIDLDNQDEVISEPTVAQAEDSVDEQEVGRPNDEVDDAPDEQLQENNAEYEPAWATDDPEPAPKAEEVVLKRRSFFDELD
ncbi:MAG: DivIVA domain-containing protein [Tunicatimonas sp.]